MLDAQGVSSIHGLSHRAHLFTSDRPSEVIDDAFVRCGLSRESFVWHDLILREGERAELPCEKGRLPGGIVEIEANGLDMFKRCVGFDDFEALRTPKKLHPKMPSRRRLDPARHRDSSRLTAKQEAELLVAGNAYLYGDSSRVRDWLPLIEQRYSFEVSVIALGRVVLPPGSELLLHVYPSLLIVEEIEFAGGSLTIDAKARVHAGRITKQEARLS